MSYIWSGRVKSTGTIVDKIPIFGPICVTHLMHNVGQGALLFSSRGLRAKLE